MQRRLFLGSSMASMLMPQMASVPSIGSANGSVMTLGVNLVEDASAPFGSSQSRESLRRIKRAGFESVAIIPFFWQSSGTSPDLVNGSALPDDRLRMGIESALNAGLRVMVKPHVWVPERWAGVVKMEAEADWQRWFDAYHAALMPVAKAAQDEGAHSLSIGTELRGTTQQARWGDIIAETRNAFSGKLTYVAHGSDELMKVRFWDAVDTVSASLYPPLGAPDTPDAWRSAMGQELDICTSLARKHGKPFWLGEVGLRSAEGATYKPWESAEERGAPAAPSLQLRVLSEWIALAKAHGIEQTLIWRWISDPDAGGMTDTDFTIQNKPAEDLLSAV